MNPFVCCALLASIASTAEPPKQIINLMEEARLAKMECRLEPKRSQSTEREDVFQLLSPKLLRVSGQGWGYLQTPESFRDYHLVIEYQWGEQTWGRRADKARDAGVFVHCHDRFGDWPKGVEAQIIEGGTGNLNMLKDGVTKRYCKYRSPKWTDLKGFRGEWDAEELFGQWNRLEVLCRKSEIEVFLNGQRVNRFEGLPVSEGGIAIQSEEAEWFIRRWEIMPLDSFKESWTAPTLSTNTGSGADLVARPYSLSPEASFRTLEIDGPFTIELVASEPLVCDPVDVIWDEHGRMFVAEMRDYPLPPEHGPLLSRIKILLDTDQDGFPDTAQVWADQLDHVQGLLPVNGGILATTRRQILLLRDTDDDNVADETEVWFESNDPRHNQLQISSPRFGPDGWIYLNNGLDGQQIYPGDSEEPELGIARRNIRIHPETLAMETVSGFGQFGATIDPWGRRFSSSNRSPIMFAAMPLHAVERNPYAGLTVGHFDIAPSGGDSLVYPLNMSHTTAAAHLGTHTAACGLSWYNGEIFVCEPTGQLVTRNRIEPNGASFKATQVRTQPQTEFLRSSDEWFRPVNLRRGPHGALYLCDMYRRFIDHSRFFPEEFSEAHYMRAGFDQGRIWRIRPTNPKSLDHQSISLAKKVHDMEIGDLINQLRAASPAVLENAIQAIESKLDSEPELLSELIKLSRHENARIRFLAIVAIGEFSDPEVTEALKSAAKKDFEDPLIRNAILSGAETRTGEILETVIRDESFPESSSEDKLAFVREFAAAIGRRANPEETQRVAETVRLVSKDATWLRLAAYEGLGKAAKVGTTELVENARLSLDSSIPMTDRLAAIPLLRLLPVDQGIEIWAELLDHAQPMEIRQAALATGARLNRTRITESLFAMWPRLDAASKTEAMKILARSPLPLLKKMEAGKINPALLDPMSRWSYLRSSNAEIKKLAESLFASPSQDRAAILTSYLKAEHLVGDVSRGHQLFTTNCAVCHQFQGEGGQIGPDISDVRNKPWQALLSDILDPNRMIEARWTAHTLERKDGPALLGLIAAETAESVTIKGLGVDQTVLRSEITSLRDLGHSLMPVGFEGSLDHQAMADLTAFLQGRKSAKKQTQAAPAQENATQKPNIILILCDNLGYGDIEPFWPETPHRTPNLNRMAAEGMKLSHFYVSAGVCTPSRASIMTGCYAQRVGLHKMEVDNHVLRPVSPLGLNPEEITIAEVLKDAGYSTSILGKWHLGDQPAFLPTQQGFDSYFGIPYSDDMTAREWNSRIWPPLPLLENEKVVEAPVDRNPLTKRYTERAIEIIRDQKDGPFFLFLSHAMPGSTKTPYSSEAFQGRSKNGPWGDSVEEIDWSTGEILDELSRLGIAENTFVIWTSDNGAPNNPADIKRGTNQPLHGRGYTTSEGGMRVPTIAWWPGKIQPGSECEELTTAMDLLPTFAQFSGQKLDQERKIDGKDISQLLIGTSKATSPHEAFYYYQLDQLQAVRSGPWKLFVQLDNPIRHARFRTGPTEPLLFNLVSDPACESNVAENHPDIVLRLEKLAEKVREDLGDTGRPGNGQRTVGKVPNPVALVK